MTLEIRGLNISDARAIRDHIQTFNSMLEVDISSNGYYENLSDLIISYSDIIIDNNIIFINKDRGIILDSSKFIDIRIKM